MPLRTAKPVRPVVPRRRVVVIDDDQALFDLVCEELTLAGYAVLGSVHSLIGLRLIQEDPPDVVVMDFMMHEMDGGTVQRKMKDLPQTEHIPILFMTAVQDPALMLNLLPVYRVLPKPFTLLQLREELRKLCDD